MQTYTPVRHNPTAKSVLPAYIEVTSISEYTRRANRKVNGAQADDIPDMVVSAIAACYGNGGYPVYWDENTRAYVMETMVFHIEITSTPRTAVMRFWPLGVPDYRADAPSTVLRFVMRKGGR